MREFHDFTKYRLLGRLYLVGILYLTDGVCGVTDRLGAVFAVAVRMFVDGYV